MALNTVLLIRKFHIDLKYISQCYEHRLSTDIINSSSTSHFIILASTLFMGSSTITNPNSAFHPKSSYTLV